jgi:hypothetical protein
MRVGAAGLALLALVSVPPASAQNPAATQSLRPLSGGSRILPVQRMTFDRWCQEVQRYPLLRCDARQPDDLRAFEAYRVVIERYEVEFLRDRERQRDILNRANQDPASTARNPAAPPAR